MGSSDTSFRSRDLLALQKTVDAELAKVSETLDRLQRRKENEIAPDVSTGDLLEIFCEERERLLRQSKAIGNSLSSLKGESTADDVLEQNRETERRRNALESNPLQTSHEMRQRTSRRPDM